MPNARPTMPNRTGTATPTDSVMTPRSTAVLLLRYFKPSGRVLEPCRGDGAFYNPLGELPDVQREWCEISEGRDFMDYGGHVDWIITNPPYSIYDEFLIKALRHADNVVFLTGLFKAFKSLKIDRHVAAFGGLREVVHLGTGTRHRFPFGFAVGALHYQRGWTGDIKYTRLYDTLAKGLPLWE